LPQNPKRQLSLNRPDRPAALGLPRLYAIVDVDLCARDGRAPLDVARAFLSAGTKLIQLRCKSWGSAAFLELATAVVDDANRAGAAVIVNDRADIAALSHAHGLHVGQEDVSPLDARTVIGDEPLLGLSTHTREQWEAAIEEPVCYIAIGPVFGTGTKDTGYSAVGLETVAHASRAASHAGLPAVAIGGVTLDNAVSVIDAGAASVAVIGDLLKGDPEARARAFLRILE
jgi:thiamine-phosphate pyrophosphorylase